MRDALDLVAGVDAGVGRTLGSLFTGAIIKPAGQLADDQDVGRAGDFPAQRRFSLEPRDDSRGAQIGVQAERLAQLQ